MKNKSRIIGTAVIAVLLVVLIVIGIILIVNQTKKDENQDVTPNTTTISGEREMVTASNAGGRGIVATPENIDEIIEEIQKPVENGYYEVSMSVDWSFDTWDTPSPNAYVENVVSNTRTAYFDLILAETNEMIYSSPFIPLGGKLKDFTLDSKLDKGEYPAVVTYHLVDDDYNELSTLSVTVNITVLN